MPVVNLVSVQWCLQVRCLEFSLVVSYIVLVTVLFGWVRFQGTRERGRLGSNVEPLLGDMGANERSTGGLQKDENNLMEVGSHLTKAKLF